MTPFLDMPIKQKLLVIIAVTTTAALLLAGVGIVVADSILFHGYLARDLSTLARIIGDNSTAALAFDDQRAASEMLSSLRSRGHIVTACLYRADGTVLGRYNRSGNRAACPAPSNEAAVRFTRTALTAAQPIVLDNRRIGTLVLLYDTMEVYERIMLYSGTVLGVLVLASLIALWLSARLRSMIAAPVLELAHTTSSVAGTKDYGIRAKKRSNDEVGMLVGAFNDMLAAIQSRDNDLKKALIAQQEALSRLEQVNADLKKTNEELARSNDDLERFAYVASHDLQEPLRMITIYSQLLIRQFGGVSDPDASEYTERITSGTRRMRELLADLLSYTEFAAVPEKPLDVVDLNEVVAKVKENLQASIEECDAALTVDPLPVVMAHQGHLIPLFQNLIGNALKYRGPERPRIHVSVAEENGAYRFGVEDNGIGIAPEYHRSIFVAFKRLHNNEIPGTGIGLAICQRVVERYGGRIWVESELGKGAKFIFTMPASGTSHDAAAVP